MPKSLPSQPMPLRRLLGSFKTARTTMPSLGNGEDGKA